MERKSSLGRLLIIGWFYVCPCTGEDSPVLHEPISPIPQTIEIDSDKATLGERLFHDPRLSKDNKLACATCHQLKNGGDDGLPRSITNSGEPDVIHAPTVFNVAFNFRQTWRGQFRTLEEQAEADLANPRHGNITWAELLPKLRADKAYATQFRRIYKKDITRESVLDALATFERSLITPNAPFDRYLRGDKDALSDDQKRGYQLFTGYGCISCHQGVNVGGNMFQKIGVLDHFFIDRTEISAADLGLFNVTGDESDRFVFKVPSLRNIQVTAPYFHDGSAPTLREAIRVMARVQLGIQIRAEDVTLIEAFLHSLTGEYRGTSLADMDENRQ